MKNTMKYPFMRALGLECPDMCVEAYLRDKRPFFICRDVFGDTDIMQQPRKRNRMFAEIIGTRLKYSNGHMIWYDGHDFVLVTWDNWKQVWNMLVPIHREPVTWAIPAYGARKSEAERIFEDARPKRSDLPKLLRADQILVLLKS
jgi:hypothetical protein